MKVNRVISWYDKKTDKLIDEVEINEISLEALRKLFNPTEDDHLMYNPYEIGEKAMRELKDKISLTFEPDKYYYYVECFQGTE